MRKPRHLCIGPGIAAVYGFVGALDALRDVDADAEVVSVSGASAGAVAGLVYCLKRFKAFPSSLVLESDLKEVIRPSLGCLVRRWGLVSQEKWVEFLEGVMASAGFDPQMTFEELHERSGVDFYVSAYDLTHQRQVTFSRHTHPGVHVVDAVAASTAIPLVFEPCRTLVNDSLVVDAAILERLPLSPFLGDLRHVLTVELARPDVAERSVPESIVAYLWSILSALAPPMEQDLDRSVLGRVQVQCDNAGDLFMDLTHRQALYDEGYAAGLRRAGT